MENTLHVGLSALGGPRESRDRIGPMTRADKSGSAIGTRLV